MRRKRRVKMNARNRARSEALALANHFATQHNSTAARVAMSYYLEDDAPLVAVEVQMHDRPEVPADGRSYRRITQGKGICRG